MCSANLSMAADFSTKDNARLSRQEWEKQSEPRLLSPASRSEPMSANFADSNRQECG